MVLKMVQKKFDELHKKYAKAPFDSDQIRQFILKVSEGYPETVMFQDNFDDYYAVEAWAKECLSNDFCMFDDALCCKTKEDAMLVKLTWK